MRLCVLVGVWISCCLFSECAKLPSTWGRCRKSDKEFSECLRKNIEFAIKSLNKPIPELGLSEFEPLNIPELYIGEGKGPVNVAQHFVNVKLHGLTNVKLLNSTADFKKKQFISVSLNPELVLDADYDLKGRVLLLPVYGKGKCKITLFDVLLNHVLSWETVERKGKIYIKPLDYKVTLKPKKMTYNFDNLFDGQKELGDNINKVLNEAWDEVFYDVRDGYEKSFGIIFKNLANRVLSKVPEKDIFLD